MATILIVDDLAANRAVLVTLLGYKGHTLIEAANGAEALAAAADRRLDLIITDVLMPAMDGYELVQQLRANDATRSVPVIFYTAHYSARDARELALSSGVAAVLAKPVDPEEVLRVVDAVLSGAEPARSPREPLAADFDRAHLRLLTDKLSENVDDLRRTNARLRALINIGLELASERDTRALLDKVCGAARDLFAATTVGLKVEPNEGHDAQRVVQGETAPGWAACEEVLETALRTAVVERRPVRGEGASDQITPHSVKIDAYLAAPVASPTHVYGWICLIKNADWGFVEDDEPLLAALAGQVGRVYENRHLYAEATRRAAELEREMRDRREAVEALRAAEERTRFALESANVGIWDMDYTTGRLRWSEIAERHYGWPSGTFPGTFDAFIQSIHPDDRDATLETIEAAMASGKDFSVQHRSVWPDGTVRWLTGAGRSMHDGDGKILRAVGISLDVTSHRSLEDQFRQAQKMEAVGRLAGGVAHDFNNMLSVILSYSELLMQELKPTDPMWEEVSEIREAGARAATLTRQLLAFSRQQVIEPSVVVLNDVLENLDKMLSRLVREDVQIVRRLAPSLGRCLCDPGQMEQVVLNLVVNACDAMPNGGTLTIETANVEFDDDYAATHLGLEPGAYVMLAVSDTGVGMDKATEARIFEPFFTTKPKNKGTGLGLSTVFGIVDQSGGRVHVYSEVGKGTTFKIYVPRTDASFAELAPGDSADVVHGSETILLVEDEKQIRAVACGILRRHGYRGSRQPIRKKRCGIPRNLATRSISWSPTSSCRK